MQYQNNLFQNVAFSILPYANKNYLCAFAMSYIDLESTSFDILTNHVFNALIHHGIINNEKGLITFYINGPREEYGFSYVIRAKSNGDLNEIIDTDKNQKFDQYFEIKYDELKKFYLENIYLNRKEIKDDKIITCMCENLNSENIKNQKFIVNVYGKITIDSSNKFLNTMEKLIGEIKDSKLYFGKTITKK